MVCERKNREVTAFFWEVLSVLWQGEGAWGRQQLSHGGRERLEFGNAEVAVGGDSAPKKRVMGRELPQSA